LSLNNVAADDLESAVEPLSMEDMDSAVASVSNEELEPLPSNSYFLESLIRF
jgi:hypothetical protein